MNQTTAFLKRHSLVLGIVLMFLLTWPIDLANVGLMPFQVPFIAYIFLGWGIVFASVIMTGLTLGKEGVVTLLKRYLKWRVGWKWYLTVFLLAPAPFILAVYISAALTGVAPDYRTVMAHKIFGESANLLILILPWFLYEIVTNGEEIGWRGYILPRLQAKHNALTSTIILGFIWGFWHLPKFLPDFDGAHFAWFMLQTMAVSVVLTWIYNGTRGSLLLVVLFHASLNTAGMFVPIANTQSGANMDSYIVYVLLEVVIAVIIVIVAGPARLSRTEPMQVQE